MPKLWIFLLIFSQLLGFSQRAWSQNEGRLQGRWRLLEHVCVKSSGERLKIAPGYPGSREEWILTFLDQGVRGSFTYSANYVGVMNQDCSLEYQGSFDIETSTPQAKSAQDSRLVITSLRLTPQRRSVHTTGFFPAPCQLFTTDRSQKFEARFEHVNYRHIRSERLRLRGTNLLKRCQGKNDRTEFLFELF